MNSKIKNLYKKISRALYDFFTFLIPPDCQCITCGEELSPAESRYAMCEKCKAEMYIKSNRCLKCDKPIPDDAEYCKTCLTQPRYFERNYSCFPYSGLPRKIIRSYKFGGYLYKKRFITSFYIDKFLSEEINADIVCAVPMTKAHYIERGYNQSLLIAEGFCERLNIPHSENIFKNKGVRRQLGLGYAERIANAENAYFFSGDDFKGKRVLVIDDVFTTGSTINSIAKLLTIDAKAEAVIGLTFCNVGDKDPIEMLPKKKRFIFREKDE